MAKNKFLTQLLTLQPDGVGAISAPSNWKEPPLLKVETQLDETVKDLADDILRGAEVKETGRWHFFVGSPGNGKSAATGEIARLLGERGCRLEVETEIGRKGIEDLRPGEIPYVIKVYEADNKFESVWIAQDASVVRNPWSSNVDPALDLLRLLGDAWKRGVSLVVCANRGVIECAARVRDYRREDWFRTLSSIVSADPLNSMILDIPEGSKRRFRQVKVTSESLDARSLLFKSRVFESLIDKAIEHPGWDACVQCPVRDLCPFLANRNWLSTSKGKTGVLEALSNAELLSGQPMVLREATALLSTVLAGCPRDYVGDASDPCEWVAERVDTGDLFGLASRRIYMVMFSSSLPRAIEEPGRSREIQFDALTKLKNCLERESSQNIEKASAVRHLTHVLGEPGEASGQISTDIGLGHLLGYRGVLNKLDPLRARLGEDFFGRWHPLRFALEESLHSGLEEKMKASWNTMYRQIEDSTIEAAPMLGSLSRWCTAFTVRIGGLSECWFNMHESLSALRGLHSGDQKQSRRRIRSLEKQLPAILSNVDDDRLCISLSEHIELTGHWVSSKLRPRLETDFQQAPFGLLVKFGDDEQRPQQSIPAEVFYWLDQRAKNGLSVHSFPRHLLETVENYLIRIATASKYSLVPDDIEIRVSMSDDTTVVIERNHGEAFH